MAPMGVGLLFTGIPTLNLPLLLKNAINPPNVFLFFFQNTYVKNNVFNKYWLYWICPSDVVRGDRNKISKKKTKKKSKKNPQTNTTVVGRYVAPLGHITLILSQSVCFLTP